MTDQQYIQALRDSDQRIIRKAYEAMKSPFIAFVRQRCKNLSSDYLDDVYQEAFLRLQQNILTGRLSEDSLSSSLQTYLNSVGYLCAQEMARKIGLVIASDERDDQSAEDSLEKELLDERSDNNDDSVDPMETMFSRERERIIRGVVEQMQSPCAPLLLGYYWDGFSMNQLALRLGYSGEDTAKNQKARCMKKLKLVIVARLQEAGYL